METYNIISQLCSDKGIAVTALETQLGFGRGSIGKLKNGGDISSSRLKKIADYFNVSVDYLMTGKSKQEEEKAQLTDRDKRDISKDLDRIMNEIKNGDEGPLYYNGVEIDQASIGLLRNAIEYALRETKKENKVKYNPNKNKK